jgi:hypothetical protein
MIFFEHNFVDLALPGGAVAKAPEEGRICVESQNVNMVAGKGTNGTPFFPGARTKRFYCERRNSFHIHTGNRTQIALPTTRTKPVKCQQPPYNSWSTFLAVASAQWGVARTTKRSMAGGTKGARGFLLFLSLTVEGRSAYRGWLWKVYRKGCMAHP